MLKHNTKQLHTTVVLQNLLFPGSFSHPGPSTVGMWCVRIVTSTERTFISDPLLFVEVKLVITVTCD